MDEQEKPRRGRPPTGVTPKRNIRVGTIWDEAEAIAKARGETMTAAVEAGLRWYISEHGPEQAQKANGPDA